MALTHFPINLLPLHQKIRILKVHHALYMLIALPFKFPTAPSFRWAVDLTEISLLNPINYLLNFADLPW